MKENEIMVEFSIYNYSEMDHRSISKIIGVEPTRIWNIGDEIRNGLDRKENAWTFTNGYSSGVNLEDELNKLLIILTPNITLLAEYVDVKKLNTKIDIVLKFDKEDTPPFFISRDFIEVCNKLGADLETDIYIYK